MLGPDKFLFQQPTLSRHACKEDLCPPGEFGSAPWILFRRPDAPLAAKVVFMALLDHLRPGRGEWVNPSVRRIMELLAMSRSQVKFWIAWLDEHRFIERRLRAGRCNLIAFAHPDDWSAIPAAAAPATVEDRGDTEAQTRSEIRPTPVRTPGDPVGNPTDHPVGNPTDHPVGNPTDHPVGNPTDHPVGNPTDPQSEIRPTPGRKSDPVTSKGIKQDNNKGKKSKAVVVDSRNSLFMEKAAVLMRIGIDEDLANRLAAISGTTALDFALLADSAPKNPRNLAGWVIKRIEAGQFGPQGSWGPKDVLQVIKRGWIVELDGCRFDEPGVQVRQNKLHLAVTFEGKVISKIPVERLREIATGFIAPAESGPEPITVASDPQRTSAAELSKGAPVTIGGFAVGRGACCCWVCEGHLLIFSNFAANDGAAVTAFNQGRREVSELPGVVAVVPVSELGFAMAELAREK